MHTSYTKLLAGVAALGLFVAAPALAGNGKANNANKFGQETTRSHDCGSAGDQVSLTGLELLWPPNHKYQDFTIVADDADDSGPTELTIELTHDQMVDGEEMNGSGNTTDDGTTENGTAMQTKMGDGDVPIDFQLRSERSGRDLDGRTYTVTYEAAFDGAAMCMGSFEVSVPHDRRDNAGR